MIAPTSLPLPGYRIGGLLVAFLDQLADVGVLARQRGDHSVLYPARKFVRPLVHCLVRAVDGLRGGRYRAAKQVNCVCLLHTVRLNHDSVEKAIMIHWRPAKIEE